MFYTACAVNADRGWVTHGYKVSPHYSPNCRATLISTSANTDNIDRRL
jgi:hypothetical protein